MNQLQGQIATLERHGSVAQISVTVGARTFVATLVGATEEMADWQVGKAVNLLFKETEVSLAKNLSGLISLRNRFACVVREINQGTILTEVTLDMDNDLLQSIITTASARALELRVGDTVEGLVKANEMTVWPIAR